VPTSAQSGKAKSRTVPAIGSNRLTHYFSCPDHIDSQQETIFAQLPKRLGHKGLLKASPQEEVIGWGLHLEEGYHNRTIFFLFVVLFLFSLTFGVVWSVTMKDLQGGFAVTSCVFTVCGMLVGFLVVQ
jgi:hypothetical protein